MSTADSNTVDPNASTTNWAPAFSYGELALSGQTGGTVTLTPVQAIKRTWAITGALTSNLTIVVPPWAYNWTIINATTGAFTTTVKTAAGAGVVIPQNSIPLQIVGDGTNITAATVSVSIPLTVNGVVQGAVTLSNTGPATLTLSTTQLALLTGAAFTGAVSAPSFNTTP